MPRLDYADLAKPKAKGERAPFGQFKGPKPPARYVLWQSTKPSLLMEKNGQDTDSGLKMT